MKLRILADDLTGALDSAAAFAGEPLVHLDRPGDDADGVSVVATATRDVAPGELPALLEPSRAWLRGADLAFKKVDSLLRGNTVAECAVLAAGHGRLVFAPAFPRQGRTTSGGRAWLAQPGGTDRQPIGDASIAERFAAAGITDAWVPDVEDDEALRRIAERSLQDAARRWLWCGSAGLAHAMATVHGLSATPPAQNDAPRPTLLLSASRHAVLRRQWVRLQQAGIARPECVDLSSPRPMTAMQAAEHLAAGMQRLVDGRPPPAALVVIGGDTLRALCNATGTRALRAGAAARAGWGRARLVGGRWDGALCHARSGAFGADDDLLDAFAAP